MEYEASMRNLLEDLLRDENASPTDLPITLLKAITKNFSDDLQIGHGGFAVVYKGLLGNGRTIAVKKLSNSIDMDEKTYNQEVGCLMRVKHKNIVRFLGYCADTQGKMCDYGGKFVMADVRQRLLCFEYLPRGNLEQYITSTSDGLEWRKRYQIMKGICEGLHYLHGQRIVHLDLKPANILLDDDMVPKIADFGLSRCFEENQTKTITSKLAGSLGYLAPEFFCGVVTLKLDIYSLGVIIMELLVGQKGYTAVECVLEFWRDRLNGSSEEILLEQIRVCAEIGIECIDSDPAKRPTIQQIIQGLNETESIDGFIKNDMTTTATTQAYDINGFTFYTKAKDGRSKSQNSGIQAEAYDIEGNKNTYYGYIDEIWKLDCGVSMQIPVFRCKWVKHPIDVEVDKYGFTLVDLDNVGHKDDPWILGSRVAQVFYVLDPKDYKKHLVVPEK